MSLKRKFYDCISLYEYVALFSLTIVALATTNSFIGSVLIFLFLNKVPIVFMQSYGYKAVDQILNIFRSSSTTSFSSVNNRPENAMNCDIINQGGSFAEKPGFPSGHSTMSAFLFFILLLEFLDKNNTYDQRKNLIPIVIITGIFMILVPMVRVAMSCHTIPQVIAGIITGLLMAILFKIVDKNLLNKMNRYQDDKNKFFNSLS